MALFQVNILRISGGFFFFSRLLSAVWLLGYHTADETTLLPQKFLFYQAFPVPQQKLSQKCHTTPAGMVFSGTVS